MFIGECFIQFRHSSNLSAGINLPYVKVVLEYPKLRLHRTKWTGTGLRV